MTDNYVNDFRHKIILSLIFLVPWDRRLWYLDLWAKDIFFLLLIMVSFIVLGIQVDFLFVSTNFKC